MHTETEHENTMCHNEMRNIHVELWRLSSLIVYAYTNNFEGIFIFFLNCFKMQCLCSRFINLH